MALRPYARKNPRPEKAGVSDLSPHKVKALRAYTRWLQAKETNPRASLKTHASAEGVRTATVWKHVHGTPKVAEDYVASVQGAVQQGLGMAIQKGISSLEAEGEEGIGNSDALAWANFFAKYTHGGFKSQKDRDAPPVILNVNVGIPAHVRARLGMDDEQTLKVDAALDGCKELIDDG